MKIISKLMIFCCLSFSIVALAQDAMQNDSSKTQSDHTGKLLSVTGKISNDGKTFTSDADGKSWTIVNPEAVKAHIGHHVTLKAHVNPEKMEINVISLKMVSAE
ncbi:MAG TPA: hypothetical protein VFA74_19955 [Terriglobales bacterium]|nr:hypothetical protein [Terriglobales bacterium]